MKKLIYSILFTLITLNVLGQSDSTQIDSVQTDKSRILDCGTSCVLMTVQGEPLIFQFVDTNLYSTVLLDPEEDIFTSSYFAVSSGLYKFPYLLDTEDYDWMSKNVMMTYNDWKFKSDTTPEITAKYDQAYAYGHWFNGSFDRMIGKSKITAKLNRNFQNELYENSKSKRENFMIATELPIRKSYNVTLGYFRNSALISETGGIYNSDSLSVIDEFNISTVFPNLSTAQNNIFQQKASLHQSINLSSKTNLDIESDYVENRFSFEMSEQDIDSNYFTNNFLDTTKTFDSIGFKKIVIKPTFQFKNNSIKIKAGVNQEFNDNNIFNNSFGFASAFFKVKNTYIKLGGQYHYENYWNGNYEVSSKIHHIKNKCVGKVQNLSNKKQIEIKFKNTSPSFIFHQYSGNHFNWNNNFQAMQILSVKGGLNLNKRLTQVLFDVQNINNYIYLDENSIPQQTSENITAGKIQVKNQIGKKNWKFISGTGFQFTTSDLIRIPILFTKNTLVYDFKLRSVPFSIGSSINYFSGYQGLNYNPSIRHYHLGNEKVGGTPVVDWFLAARLAPADLYIKYDNSFYTLNRSLFIGENYPIYKSFLRLGLKWKFND